MAVDINKDLFDAILKQQIAAGQYASKQPQADPVYLTCDCGSQTMMIEPTRYVCSECGREQ